MALKRVFEPILIGNVEVPNRIMRTAHNTQLSATKILSGDELINYHLARAKGGVGLSIIEGTEVHNSCVYGPSLADDSVIPFYRDLMKAIRPTGMRMFQQLWHGGHISVAADGGPAWGVSTVPSVTGQVAMPMTQENIEELIEAYAKAVVRCREGGLDGVEFHFAFGYLAFQFMSPVLNNRTDKYGGNIENRMRFTIEALSAMRKAVGEDYVIGIRLSSSKTLKLPEEDICTLISTIEQQGLTNYVNASIGDHYNWSDLVGAMHMPVGYQLPSASKLTAASRRPRMVTGRFRTLEEVEEVLQAGTADLVSMVRAHIADPDIVRKTREGRVNEIRPCIACNQGCIGGLQRNNRLGCTVNVAVGFEATLSEDLIVKTSKPRRVLIVGGGPAGMEAARVGALIGHDVKLVEASPSLGGNVNIAKRAPNMQTTADITDWLERELHRLQVKVQLNTFIEAEEIRAEQPDVVIIATGSIPRMDGFQKMSPLEIIKGFDLPHVSSSVDIMTRPKTSLAGAAVVFDDVGHLEAIAVAEYLMECVAVTFVTSQYLFGGNYVTTTERDVPALERLYGLGDFRVLERSTIREITASECLVGPLQSKRSEVVPANHVVLVTHNEPSRSLYDELFRELPNVILVGDAKSPRDIQAAIQDGHLAMRAFA